MNKRKTAAAGLIALGILVTSLTAFWAWHDNTTYSVVAAKSETPSESAAQIPDITHFTTAAVTTMLPPLQNGVVTITAMSESPYFTRMAMTAIIDDFAESQNMEEPVSIEINSGVYSLDQLASAVSNSEILVKTHEGWLLKKPLIVHPGATLIISGPENALKLSADKGAFISSFGDLYVVDTTLTGWSEQENAPSVYSDSDIFRPYLVSWSGSKTWLASSRFLSLGYNAAKSYGITFSATPSLMNENSAQAMPTGWIIDSHFSDLYNGFYSNQAENVAIIGNVYDKNIMNGIDPHDKSQRLIIAENTISNTINKHGIILSDNISNSWIFSNRSLNNKGSGILLERNSRNNMISNNISEKNGGDGLVFFESPDNTSSGNSVLNNGKNGVRIRNSTNILMRNEKIIGNNSYGIEAYSTSIKEQESFVEETSYDISDSLLENNREGHFQTDNVNYARYSNLTMLKSLKFFKGDFEQYEGAICKDATLKDIAVKVTANTNSIKINAVNSITK